MGMVKTRKNVLQVDLLVLASCKTTSQGCRTSGIVLPWTLFDIKFLILVARGQPHLVTKLPLNGTKYLTYMSYYMKLTKKCIKAVEHYGYKTVQILMSPLLTDNW